MFAQDADREMRTLLSFYSSARPNLNGSKATEFTSETKGSKAVELPLPTRYVRKNRPKSKECELISQENSKDNCLESADSDFSHDIHLMDKVR
jgi:hypothetical protein